MRSVRPTRKNWSCRGCNRPARPPVSEKGMIMEHENPGDARPDASEVPLIERKLRRSSTDRMVAGVLGGIGETYGINSTLLRILFVASVLLPGPQLIFYFVMWLIMPGRDA